MEPNRPRVRVDSVQDEVAALYAVAYPRLVGLLTVIGGSRPDAEEVAQEAFVRLLEHWPKVRRYQDPEGWVRTVAIRMLISRGRRRTSAETVVRRLAWRAQPTPPAIESDEDLVAALATLPMAQRAVVVLHHAYDLSVDDIATRLRIPVGTVKSRLHQARRQIRPWLSTTT